MNRIPAQVFSLAETLYDELVERGWKSEDAAARMETSGGFGLDLFMLDMILCVPEEKLLITDDVFEGLGRAFDVDPIFFKRIHDQWDKHTDRRSPFTVPEEIFGPISVSQIQQQHKLGRRDTMADELDTGNKFMVGVSGARIVMLNPPRGTITKDDALNLAAWLVALADDNGRFSQMLETVQNT